VRPIRFERRSALPVSAACVVANGVRETLGALLATPVSLRLLAPVIPNAAAWNAICTGAQIVGVRGSACDAAFVVRAEDALTLASGAFGEEAGQPRTLSTVEQEVLMRALRGISGALAPICGRDVSPLERIDDIHGYVTYFELLVERPVWARIGVALSREPVARASDTLRVEDLLHVPLEISVQFAAGTLSAAAFMNLHVGDGVAMKTRVGEPGLLKAGGTVLARGQCGALHERSAIIVTALR
jgi:flagellar motor switch protein FliM